MTREERENALHCLKVMIDEEVCEECKLYGSTGTDHCEADCVRVAIKALEEPKTVSIPEGATNGDVFTIMFNKTFPNTIVMYENDESRLTISPIFSREWWEMPYKAESEE